MPAGFARDGFAVLLHEMASLREYPRRRAASDVLRQRPHDKLSEHRVLGTHDHQ
jgi:hypothetical protein